jgi:plasmid stabilization system protein ParE
MTKAGFHPAAATELRAAASYYEARVAKLGEELIAEVERATGLLTEYPSLGSRCDAQHRRFDLRRFPFALIYRADRSRITIVAVAHTKRRPGYWDNRS